ncbi:unnamed protein product, partial [Polarella glacialis]
KKAEKEKEKEKVKEKDKEKEKEKGRSRERSRSRSRRRSRSRDRDRKKEKSKSKSKSRERGGGDEDENADVSVEVLDEVESFGKMMMLAPALLKKIRRMTPENVAAACRAMTRTKFFDADILRDLNDVLKRLLQRNQLSSVHVNDVLTCLYSINAYDQGVLSAVATCFRTQITGLDPMHRAVWQEIFKGFKHELEKDFLQLLETPPLTAISPGYQRIRCFHHSRGFCAVGDK